MHKLTWFAVLACFMAGVHTGALACNTSYDPQTGALFVPCVDIQGDPRSFSAALQDTGGNQFAVTQVIEFNTFEPVVAELRIIERPPFAYAIVSGQGTCIDIFQKSVSQAGDNVDIRVRARVPVNPVAGCAAVLTPFVETLSLPPAADRRAQNYSVNGFRITPTF